MPAFPMPNPALSIVTLAGWGVLPDEGIKAIKSASDAFFRFTLQMLSGRKTVPSDWPAFERMIFKRVKESPSKVKALEEVLEISDWRERIEQDFTGWFRRMNEFLESKRDGCDDTDLELILGWYARSSPECEIASALGSDSEGKKKPDPELWRAILQLPTDGQAEVFVRALRSHRSSASPPYCLMSDSYLVEKLKIASEEAVRQRVKRLGLSRPKFPRLSFKRIIHEGKSRFRIITRTKAKPYSATQFRKWFGAFMQRGSHPPFIVESLRKLENVLQHFGWHESENNTDP